MGPGAGVGGHGRQRSAKGRARLGRAIAQTPRRVYCTRTLAPPINSERGRGPARPARTVCPRPAWTRARPRGQRSAGSPLISKELSLGKDPALLSTGLSASAPSRSLRNRRLETRLESRGSGPGCGAARSGVPGGARPFSAPPLSTGPGFLPPPSQSLPPSYLGDPHRGQKDQTAALDTKGSGFLGAAGIHGTEGSPGGFSTFPGDNGGGLTSPSTKRAGRGERIDAHPRAPRLTSPPLSRAKQGTLGCVGCEGVIKRQGFRCLLRTDLHLLTVRFELNSEKVGLPCSALDPRREGSLVQTWGRCLRTSLSHRVAGPKRAGPGLGQGRPVTLGSRPERGEHCGPSGGGSRPLTPRLCV